MAAKKKKGKRNTAPKKTGKRRIAPKKKTGTKRTAKKRATVKNPSMKQVKSSTGWISAKAVRFVKKKGKPMQVLVKR